MAHRSYEPLFWVLFSAGGVVAAFFLPALSLLFGLAIPMSWVAAPSWGSLVSLTAHPLVRILLSVLSALPLYHFAHRFRFTLYDGLQIKHLNELIFTFCYGVAAVGTILAVWFCLRLP